MKVILPAREDSLIIDHLKKARREQEQGDDATAVAGADFVGALIEHYNFEVDAGVRLIREYNKLRPYMMNGIGDDVVYKRPILKLEIDGSNRKGTVNGYVERTRLKYWKALFENKEFVRSLPNNLQSELHSRINEIASYEFSSHNIKEMWLELDRKTAKSMEDTILSLFDELSHKHHWYNETSGNIHYFNGWKTNKAHKINKKVIIPLRGFDDNWKRFSYTYTVKEKLHDIEKCLAFLDGGQTPDVDLDSVLRAAQDSQASKDIELKYFRVTFFKKGTCHLTFIDQRLLDKFNIFGCQRKGWLPPSYGRKRKPDMTREEAAAVDSFGGDYDAVVRDSEYYIVESGQLLIGAGT